MPDRIEPRWRLLANTNLAQARKRAKDLLDAYRRGETDARSLFGDFHPDPPAPPAAKLADAQLTFARAYDFPSWPRFVRGAELFNAILADDPERVTALIDNHPALLHEPVNGVTSNWGPPLACAAQVGSRRVFDALLPIADQDRQHALDRAILRGRGEFARKLIAAGAVPEPGIVMGPCESLNVAGLEFLAAIGAPLGDENGDALAPVAMLLEGYFRDPTAKHACLAFFEKHGVEYPNTPAVAFHRGRLDLLKAFLEKDPRLPYRQFSYREIYPRELGCHDDESLGLHGTPLNGATLLHMSDDFDEADIFHWLLDADADVNAAAVTDRDGFGGHTPIFSAVVSQAYRSGRQRDGAMATGLIEHGADPGRTASIRKAIRFISDESEHCYTNVTPLEYGRQFHARAWVSGVALDAVRAALGSPAS